MDLYKKVSTLTAKSKSVPNLESIFSEALHVAASIVGLLAGNAGQYRRIVGHNEVGHIHDFLEQGIIAGFFHAEPLPERHKVLLWRVDGVAYGHAPGLAVGSHIHAQRIAVLIALMVPPFTYADGKPNKNILTVVVN